MAPAAKRRRVANDPAKEAVAAAHIGGIQSYGKISRASTIHRAGKEDSKPLKRKQQLAEADINVLNGSASRNAANTSQLKRKSASDPAQEPFRKASRTGTDQKTYIKIEQTENENKPALPPVVEIDTAVVDTPTKPVRTALESFSFKSSPSRQSKQPCSSVKAESSATSSSPSVPTPCPRKRRRGYASEDELPAPVQDFLDLHSSFLTALSLHYAHHGTAAPVDLKQLGPSVSKLWRKRAITPADIRRLLGVQQRSVDDAAVAALLSVWDYGKGKTVVEYCSASAPSVKQEIKDEVKTETKQPLQKKAWNAGVARQPLDSVSLSRHFHAWIHEQYNAFSINEGANASPEDFIESLPLARLHRRAVSRASKSVILSKGQARLTDLKNGAITRHAKDASKDELAAQSKTKVQDASSTGSQNAQTKAYTPPSQRGSSLLSRIRAKETFLASQPAGPTAEQLAHRAALHRVPDIVSVLTVLAGNSSNNTSAYGSLIGRSGIIPSSTTPLTNRLNSISLGGGGGNDDDALLAALGGASGSSSFAKKEERTASFGSTASRGLAAMFVGRNSPLLSPVSDSSAGSLNSLVSNASSGTSMISNLSISMSQVIERIQNSMRTPISRQEAEDVVRVIATDVAPEWITIREIGSVKGVVIRGSKGPERGWREKVQALVERSLI